MKLAVVGGGSTYTPELIDGFARMRDVLPIEELWLVDTDPERLRLVGGMSDRMFRAAGHTGRIVPTSDLVAGVADADAVLIQLRVGGQAARHGDETFPHECGCIGQETTGPGGFAKALRTVPVVLSVAEVVRKHAKPDAWIVDFTNPVGIVTRALLNEGHRAVGLCNVAIGFQRRFANLLGVDHSQVQLGHVGLNHLTWERSVTVTDDTGTRDALPALLGDRLAELAEEIELPASLLSLLGNVPSYYLRYYYAHDEVLREQLDAPTRAEAVQRVERELLELYADPSVDTKPEQLSQRGGAFYSEAAVDLIASLTSDRGDVQVVNLRNGGSLPFLPDDHVIEVPATVGAAGLSALPIAPLPDDIRGLVSHVAGYERLALEAAVHGGRDRVVRAMLAHPLVGQYDRAEKLTDLLIAGNRDHLAWAH
ncbi:MULTISPECIES: 6-phospho-beta-glucosidase [unclassified Leifsonia]|uniref:6-phospho-beta-glucosidase n=1 Tax=unclassified Leifsonia TaxID=2663824 RepID=UPI00092BB5AC|nr:6-phospho-beta-glucosidase [Leifsonia sp. 71-9]OJX74116.1 MAG: 6-phospho-beta-glucosidase [Leifsonia sp. 71-9]